MRRRALLIVIAAAALSPPALMLVLAAAGHTTFRLQLQHLMTITPRDGSFGAGADLALAKVTNKEVSRMLPATLRAAHLLQRLQSTQRWTALRLVLRLPHSGSPGRVRI